MIRRGDIAILVGFMHFGGHIGLWRHIGFEAKFRVAQKHFSNSVV